MFGPLELNGDGELFFRSQFQRSMETTELGIKTTLYWRNFSNLHFRSSVKSLTKFKFSSEFEVISDLKIECNYFFHNKKIKCKQNNPTRSNPIENQLCYCVFRMMEKYKHKCAYAHSRCLEYFMKIYSHKI